MSSSLRSPKSPLSPKSRNSQLTSILMLGGIIIIVSGLAFLIWYFYVAQHFTPSTWNEEDQSPQNQTISLASIDGTRTPLPAPTLNAQIDQEENAVVEIEESKNTPLVSIFKEQEQAAQLPPEQPTSPILTPKTPSAQRLALVIDTYGGTPSQLKKLAQLGLPLTIAVVPFDPHAHDFIKIADGHGLEIIADIPMESTNETLDPGPHTLRTGQSVQAIRTEIKNSLKKVPAYMGAKNRMGSKFTASAASMDTFFTAFPPKKNFFFLDALTGKSVAKKSAHKSHTPYVQRTLFIDNVPIHEKIMTQLRTLQLLAAKHPQLAPAKQPIKPIVGLGNLRPETIKALGAWAKERSADPSPQTDIVPLSQLLGLGPSNASPPSIETAA